MQDDRWRENGKAISDSEHASIWRSVDWLRDDVKDLRTWQRWTLGLIFMQALGTIGLLADRIW